MGLMQALNERLTGASWPPRWVSDVWEDIELHAALRMSDDTRIRQQASVDWHENYIITPLARVISRASANQLYGEPPEIKAADEGDQDSLELIVRENGLESELHRAAMIASSEGEVWGRVSVVPDVLDVPIVEFCSRGRVIPYFQGRFLKGATFVTEWWEGHTVCYRLLETYEAGFIGCELYRGGSNKLGTKVDLQGHPLGEGRVELLATGLDYPLCAFIPNSIDTDPTRGFSDYRGLEDRFIALNEATTVGQANLRLAGKKRAIVHASYTDKNGDLPKGADIFVVRDQDSGAASKGSGPLQVIDYSFEAQANIDWINHLIDSTLSYAGISPQSIGRSVDGGAVSGTALKLKMSHSLLEAAGKGRHLDQGVLHLLRAAQELDASEFGRPWAQASEFPTISRQDGLPFDEQEAAQVIATLASASAISPEEKVRAMHPDWSDEQLEAETDLVRQQEEANRIVF